MSRREGRDSHGKRHYTRFDREPSDKRARRDENPASGRPYSISRNLDNDDVTQQNKKSRSKDEVPSATENNANPEILKTGSDSKAHVMSGGTKHISEPSEAPRSLSYVQHDERSSAGQGGRSHIGRSTDHGRWRDSKDQSVDKVKERESANLQRRDDRSQVRRDDNKSWKHDAYFKLEADAPPARRRPAFTEKKRPSDPVPIGGAKESESRFRNEQIIPDDARREQVNDHSLGVDKHVEPLKHDDERNDWRGRRFLERSEQANADFWSRERYEGRGPRGRERFNRRYNDRNRYQQVQPQKWKHDLFNEANRSPTPKNEEEQIAKVEALLSL